MEAIKENIKKELIYINNKELLVFIEEHNRLNNKSSY